MKTVGVIVEYNPLHNGHVYHFEQSRAATGADAVVAVMSGHFLQRGEPAVVSKWARAEMALRMGADIVIELPVAYASHAAEWFAYGAVSLLDATGVVDSVCFGSESGDISRLLAVAQQVSRESEAFRRLVREEVATGRSYPSAYSAAVERYIGDPRQDEHSLQRPNNTLGLHYLIALQRIGSNIRPFTIARHQAGYSQTNVTDNNIASATAIRKLLFESGNLPGIRPYVPAFTYDILAREAAAGRAPLSWSEYARPLLHKLVGASETELAGYAEVSEGLEHRIKQALPGLTAASGGGMIDELLQAVKTKRYTHTKLQRTLLRILLGHRKEELTPDKLRDGAAYLRILGFSKVGRQLLSRMRHNAKVPVVTKVTASDAPYLALDIRATSVYALGYSACTADDMFRDYYEPPLQLASVDQGDFGGNDSK